MEGTVKSTQFLRALEIKFYILSGFEFGDGKAPIIYHFLSGINEETRKRLIVLAK